MQFKNYNFTLFLPRHKPIIHTHTHLFIVLHQKSNIIVISKIYIHMYVLLFSFSLFLSLPHNYICIHMAIWLCIHPKFYTTFCICIIRKQKEREKCLHCQIQNKHNIHFLIKCCAFPNLEFRW